MVDGINFNGNVQGTKNGRQIKQNNVVLPKFVFADYFNRFTAAKPQVLLNDRLTDLQGSLSPAAFAALLQVQDNFSNVPDTVLRNTQNENLVIKDSDFIPDREYEEAEV